MFCDKLYMGRGMKEINDKLLRHINSPDDLKKLNDDELLQLTGEIRELLIAVVAENGGHLAPNLGVVELTVALHYVFDSPHDKLVWDVGHQAYVHKLLTGRQELFRSLRQFNGCSGFLSRQESEHDIFGAGHAGTAISAALGLAAARDIKQENHKVVAIVGDGSLNCGISLEGLNNIRETTRDMIIVLNDNKMSISENVGAIPRCLNHIISGRSYNRFKAMAKMMLHKMPHGEDIRRGISRLEEATKSIFVPGVFFEELGIRYIGPVDGHDIKTLKRTFEAAKEFNRPVIIHTITEKGRGYTHAESAPEKFHGLASFDPITGEVINETSPVTYSSAFGKSAVQLAQKHDDVVAVVAAMGKGVGLGEFSAKLPERFFDVGIAEAHAAVFAAGLAAGNTRPVVAIYSTFLQRALDCVMHDVCLQKLPVIFCQDRSGVVEDGPTHHGVHDLAFLRNLPNLVIMQPATENELRDMLFTAYGLACPVVIRYPRTSSGHSFDSEREPHTLPVGKSELVTEGTSASLLTSGNELKTARIVAEILAQEGIDLAIINTRFIRPFDREMLHERALKAPLITLENNQTHGGLASVVDEELVNARHHGVLHLGWGNDEFIPHGQVKLLREAYGLTPPAIADKIRNFLKNLPTRNI